MSLLPKENLTEHEKDIYKVYVTARECISGSMIQLYTNLGMGNDEFYLKYDSDVEFRTAILDGLSDSRSQRMLELESALVNLALGVEVEETKTVESDEGTETTTIRRKYPPNLSALQVLLVHYQGSSWVVPQKVELGASKDPREIDYNMLSKSQLKQLAYSESNAKEGK